MSALSFQTQLNITLHVSETVSEPLVSLPGSCTRCSCVTPLVCVVYSCRHFPSKWSHRKVESNLVSLEDSFCEIILPVKNDSTSTTRVQLCLKTRGRHFHHLLWQHHSLNTQVWHVIVLFFFPLLYIFLKSTVPELHSSETTCTSTEISTPSLSCVQMGKGVNS